MSIDIYLDPLTGDIDLTNNTMRLTETIPESSRQQVLIDLSTFKGEWYANILAGIPYLVNDYNPVQLLGTADKVTFDIEIKGSILSRENIASLASYESIFNKQERTLTVSFEAITNTGEEVVVEGLQILI